MDKREPLLFYNFRTTRTFRFYELHFIYYICSKRNKYEKNPSVYRNCSSIHLM